jgi:hypothetical protein
MTMNDLTNTIELWRSVAVGALITLGVALFWRGLRGGPAGARGVLRTRDGMLGRIEGFRLAVFGLVLLSVGVAAITEARWLLLLAVGIGFVEILESSALIAVWKWDRRRTIVT